MKNKIRVLIMSLSVILGLVFTALLCMNKKMMREVEHKCSPTNQNYQAAIGIDYQAVVQEFAAQYDYLKYLYIIIDKQNDMASEGILRMVIYDEAGTICAAAERPVSELQSNVYEKFYVDVELQKGKVYYFTLEVLETDGITPNIVYRPLPLDRIEENRNFYYNGVCIKDASAACKYVYALPLLKIQIALYTAFCVMICMMIGNVICHIPDYFKKKDYKNREIS